MIVWRSVSYGPSKGLLHGTITTMTDPDIDDLFAPIAPSAAFGVMLNEARDVLRQVRQPVDAELWGSDMLGAFTRAADTPEGREDLMAELAATLVPAAEEAATPESLALLRIFSALGSSELRKAANDSAERLAASGIPDRPWATELGAPKTGECWHYSDVNGQQESVTMTFAYGERVHALSVLIDHHRGGKLRDAWASDAAGLLDKTFMAAETDPTVVFGRLEAKDALDRIRKALEAGEAPEQPDQADSIRAHRALIRARLDHATS